MFEYLIMQLLKLGIAPYPVTTTDRLYFTLNKATFYIIAVDKCWTLIEYTYQHNAESIMNSAEIIPAGDWRRVIKTLAHPVL